MQTEPNWGLLAARVRSARGLRSQKAISAAGGPSDTTLSKIEADEWRPTRGVDETLTKLDQGLGWPAGTAAAILSGHDPAALPPIPPAHKDRRQREADMEATPRREPNAPHIPDYSLLAATLSLESDDLRWTADRLQAHIDIHDPDEVENLLSEIDELLSAVEYFTDTVDEIVKKMVPATRLQYLKNETRRLLRQHARQSMLGGLTVTPSIGMEAKLIQPETSPKGDEGEEIDRLVDQPKDGTLGDFVQVGETDSVVDDVDGSEHRGDVAGN